jgi:hypothetical protein
MTNQESTTQASESQESSRSKSGKRKAIFKRSKTEGSSGDPAKSVGASDEQSLRKASSESVPNGERDPQTVMRIQERAYWLFQAGGFKHGHDLEHWLEAERQVAESSDLTAA